ncbi:MAG TPA: ATP-binding protein, partial [Steroidobacteraceae bacterium]|nr:ATP-binding protein [Steroidobacteraceae bacterium]
MDDTKPQNAAGPAAERDLPPIFEQLLTIARTSALEEMASGFAHELNQPLGAIAAFAQAGHRMLARPEPMVAAATDVMQQINKEALGAGEGIKRIRRLFNREAAKMTRTSIGDLLNELAPLLRVLGTRTGVQMELDIASGIPDVLIDRLRIQHVLFTLVQNAFEASRSIASTSVVKISAASDRYSVEVAVTDHGSGVSLEVGEQLFRPFFTTKPHGTGLGLASSRAIVEMHDGTI